MIVTLGEAMVRLAPPHFQRIEQARAFDVEVGGAELNTAVGLVRLGREACWVSALPDNPLGRLVLNRAREAGVDTGHVELTADGRCGLYFLEFGAAPRPGAVVYDRKGSAISKAKPGEASWPSFLRGRKAGTFDWKHIFDGAAWFHLSGITPALSDTCAEVAAEAMQAAHAAGLGTSVDLNYRSKLWTPGEAGRTMGGLIGGCTLLIASDQDAEQVFGVKGATFADAAHQLCDRFGLKHVAGVVRDAPLVWRNRYAAIGYTAAGGECHQTPGYEVEIVDRLGAGDALAAGLIHGLLDGDFIKGLEYGAAMGALKHTIPGDLPWITKEEVEATMAGQGLRIQR